MDDVARRNRLRATFDGIAEPYDSVRPPYPRAVVDDLVALTGLEPGRADRVLEIGCGTGQLTVELGPALDDLREGLLDCVDALIDPRYNGTVTKRYLAELVVAPRR